MKTYLVILNSGERLLVEGDSVVFEGGIYKIYAEKICIAMIPGSTAVIDNSKIIKEKKNRPDVGIRYV